MKPSQNRKSIFRKLVNRIFLILVFFNIVISAYITFDEINKENRTKETRARIINNEINTMIGYINSNIENLEKNNSIKQEKICMSINEQLNYQKDEEININQLIDKLNYDTTKHIVSLIKNGKIINSNFPEEINKDIFETLNPNDSAYFRDKVMTGDIFTSKFLYREPLDQFRIISLVPVKNNQYVIIVNSNSTEFNIIVELLKIRLLEIVSSLPSIKSVNFWLFVNNQRIPLLNDSLNNIVTKNITLHLMNKDSIIVETKQHDKVYRIKHLYKESNRKIYNISGVSVSVIMDYTDQYQPAFRIIRNRILLLALSLIVFFAIIYFATQGLKLTINDMLIKTSKIGKGNFNERVNEVGNDEFTTLAEHFNDMVEKVESAHIQLKEQNEEIIAQRDEIIAQRDEIEAQHNYTLEQKEIIEKQKMRILDSIEYAQRIQDAVLPENSYFNQLLPMSFVFFRPRDIVSGDFYWIEKVGQEIVLVVADCTGHGVPGAFMSMLGIGLLNEIVIREEITKPDQILNELRKKIKYALKQTGKQNEAQDGMDMAVCSINKKEQKLQFAGAMNSLVFIRSNELIEFKGDLMPVGVYFTDNQNFTCHEVEIKENDTFYMFSDGFGDQMGGPKGRKFMSTNFKKYLAEISNYPINEQKALLEKAFVDWKKDCKQIDDVLVVGFKVF